MANYTQTNRPMLVETPLGEDKLLLVGFTGQEALSQLFDFHLDLVAENDVDVQFDKLLGQSITITLDLPSGQRYFNGICIQAGQGERNDDFTAYQVEIVPQFWLLTRHAQSRIFQQMSVPDILKKVLNGVNVAFELQGTFDKRDYCVQYRETDFNFASRLMEEEGIYYFFKHQDGNHTMVLANTPQSHSAVPGASTIIFEAMNAGYLRDEDRITEWEKVQQLRSGKYTTWDYTFQMPDSNLNANDNIQSSVQVGTVTHKLAVGGNQQMELYDFPGECAQRFDGIDPGGSDRAADLQKIFPDKDRTVKIRMQQEAVPSIVIRGTSACRNLTSGHKFTLDRHFNADGDYVLTSVQHSATQGDYRSNDQEFQYQNSFTCIPFALPFRPIRHTPKPVVQGTQTAFVVGPAGEEIFTDKYSRVKVQFHWDREGKDDANSSCWIRVGTIWAGNQWGVIHIPRIGQEVIVAFEEGDPDQPIIIGSVYNPDQMPPYLLPDNKTISGMKSRSTLKGQPANYNELRFEDKKGSEHVYFHAEKDFHRYVEHNDHLINEANQFELIEANHHRHINGSHYELVDGNEQYAVSGTQDIVIGGTKKELNQDDHHLHINGDQLQKIDGDQDLQVSGDQTESVEGNVDRNVGGDRTENVGGDEDLNIGGDRVECVGGSQSLTVGQDQQESIGQNLLVEAGEEVHFSAGMTMVLEAGMELTIKSSGGFISIGPAGVVIQGTMVLINSGGAAGTGTDADPDDPESPEDPDDPDDAQKAQPTAPTMPQPPAIGPG